MRLPNISQLKNILHIKDALITRAFVSSIQNEIADEIASDAPFNILNSFKELETFFFNEHSKFITHPDKLELFIQNAEYFLFWILIGVWLFYANNNKTNTSENNLNKLKPFIPYHQIKRYTSCGCIVLIYLLTKNVSPVV